MLYRLSVFPHDRYTNRDICSSNTPDLQFLQGGNRGSAFASPHTHQRSSHYHMTCFPSKCFFSDPQRLKSLSTRSELTGGWTGSSFCKEVIHIFGHIQNYHFSIPGLEETWRFAAVNASFNVAVKMEK